MTDKIITAEHIEQYTKYLRQEERAAGTVEKYLRDVGFFSAFAEGRPVDKALVAAWKERLVSQNYAPKTVNSMLAAVHGFLDFLNWEGCRVRYLKVQRRLFRDPKRELTRQEYVRLVAAAEGQGRKRLSLLLETICATGIRVSEVRYITAEAVQKGKTEISLKGKIRTILLPGKLCRKLQKYARKNKIASGELFLTGSGKGLSRRQIWAELKSLCKQADVEPTKVFPHNLRHVFAKAFYKACKDMAKLADILGHSSIETTRVYLMTSGEEHTNQLEKLGLVT